MFSLSPIRALTVRSLPLRGCFFLCVTWCARADAADAALQRLLSAPVPKVQYRHTPRRRSTGVSESRAGLSHNVWTKLGTGGTLSQQERVDLSYNSLPFTQTLGLTASVQLTALHFTEYGANLTRFRPNVRSQLYVWDAEINRRQRAHSVVGSVGRLLPLHAPGIAILDGAQAGYRGNNGLWELGAYGGFLPDPITLGLGGPRRTAGVYLMHRTSPFRDTWLQTTARLGYTTVADGQSRYELETQWSLSRGKRLQIALSPRLGARAHAPHHLDLEAVRLAVSTEIESLVAFAEARWSSYYLTLADGYLHTLGAVRSTGLADVSLRYQHSPYITFAATSYYSYDGSAAGAYHVSSGPEIVFPRLYGSWGGASIMYLTEQGTALGQTFALQSTFVWEGKGQLLARGWLWQDVFQDVHIFEVGAYGRLDVPLCAWLSAQVWVMYRQGLYNHAINQSGLANVEGTVRLAGQLF